MAEAAQADPKLRPRRRETPEDPREFYLNWIGDAEADVTEAYGIELPFFEYENTYWRERKRENVLFVHYNDMKADLAGEMRRIAKFLDIKVADDVLRTLAEAATFESMRRDGDALVPMARMAWDKGAERFINKGTNERWKDFLTKDDLARYERQAAKYWSKAEDAWIRHGRLIAGEPRDLPD